MALNCKANTCEYMCVCVCFASYKAIRFEVFVNKVIYDYKCVCMGGCLYVFVSYKEHMFFITGWSSHTLAK